MNFRIFNRRTLLASAFAAGCSGPRAPRYQGWLFVASAAEKSLAIADLSAFRRATAIPLPAAPAQVLRVASKIFVTCPDARLLLEIDPDTFRIAARIALPGRIVSAAVCPNSFRIALLTDQPAALHLIDPATRRLAARIPLPGPSPTLLDVSDDLAVTSAPSAVTRISLKTGRLLGTTDPGFAPGVLRLHTGAKLILTGSSNSNQMATVDSDSGALLARLPLAFTPARFCFNSDGGQMFVTGQSGDEIAIVSPYQSEVEQTIVAGRTPSGMAVSAFNGLNLLFVTNPGSGDLTIFDIDTRRLAGSVHVGGSPGEVLITPDGEYALVVGRDSGDVSVVRVKTALDKKNRVKPLFTVFATAQQPRSAAILPKA